MAKKIWNKPINKNTDWGGDESTEGLPVSGEMVQKFIKESLNGKAGVFYYDTDNNRYLVFSDTSTRDEYLEDTSKVDLILGTFDAPFNYTAEINLLSPQYNAIQKGTIGNYLRFTYDVKNKQGASTGENVIITITFIRNSVKKEVKQLGKYGETINFNVDDYIDDGANTVIIGVMGQTSLAATTLAVTYQVVDLKLSDELDITKSYNLTTGSKVLEIPFTISGYGTKTMEWYLDGEKLPFEKSEDEILETSSSRIKYIQLSNLSQGTHSIQFRAYTTLDGEKFYSATLYRDVIIYTESGNATIIATAFSVPSKHGILTERPVIYGLEQYVPYTIRFATFSPTEKESVNVQIVVNGETKGTIASKGGVINEFSFTPTVSGEGTLSLIASDAQYDLAINVGSSAISIEEITNALKLDFNAIGRSNNTSGKDSWSYGDYTGTFSGFKWNNASGWVNNRLKFEPGSSFSIDYAPLAEEATTTGKTIELEFKTTAVKNNDAIICDLRNSSGTGILITATKVSLISKNKVEIATEFKSDELVRITFVINRASGVSRKGLAFIYTNGVSSRVSNFSAYDSFISSSNITFSATEEVSLELKQIRIYDTALSDNQVLNNFILYRDSSNEMVEVFNRNAIYEEGTETFSPEKTMSRLPVMLITGDIPVLENTSDKNTQIVVDIEYYNLQHPDRNFKMKNAAMRPQGTSSMGYPKKNFRIYTQKRDDTILYDANGNVVGDRLYQFKDKAQPVNCWCLKADYAESSGTHNTGIARLWNSALFNVQLDGEYVCRTAAQKAAIENGYEYDVRTTIDGFPILMYYRLTENDGYTFMGKYNFNNDKSTESVFGFKGVPGFDNTKMQCWEVLNNGNAIALFNTVSNFENAWSDAFESRYPDTSSPDITYLKSFCTWMVNVTQSNFATQKWEHMNVYMMAAYYIYLMRYAAADQFVKNAMFTSEDGVHFYYILYDNDTINGLINTGRLSIKPTDTRQTTDDSGSYVFAGHDSRLWNMLEADSEFMDIVSRMDNALYSAGISYLNSIKIFDEEQADKWVERVYNQDAEYKYIGPYVNSGVNNLFMLQGKRDLHRRWWLANRFSIYDAKYVSGTYKSQSVEIKCINGTAAGQKITIQAGYPLDYGYGVNNVPIQKGITLSVGEQYTFVTKDVLNLGDPIRIYGAPRLSSLSLAEMADRLAVLTVTNAYSEELGTMLESLVVGNVLKDNNELTEISGLKMLSALKILNVSRLKKLTSLDLSGQSKLEYLYTSGSGVGSIVFAKGAPLTTVTLSNALTVLALEELPNITFAKITRDGGINGISRMEIKSCPKLSNDFLSVYSWISLKSGSGYSFYMDNISWLNISASRFIEICDKKIAGDDITLKGRVYIDEANQEIVNKITAAFGENVFKPTSELYVSGPDSVFLSGPDSILEGESAQFVAVIFSQTVGTITYKISSGSRTGTSIDSETGKLTSVENGLATSTLTILAQHIPTTGEIINATKTLSIVKRTYPSSVTIRGEKSLQQENNEFTLETTTTGVNGNYTTEWELTGDITSYATILTYDKDICVVNVSGEPISVVTGTLKATLKKVVDKSTVTSASIELSLIAPGVIMTNTTNPEVMAIMYAKGLAANETYMTKIEAAAVTDSEFGSGTSSIFYGNSAIKTFNEFRYFKGVTSINSKAFYNCTSLTSIEIPSSVTSIGESAFDSCVALTSIEIPSSVKSIGDYAFNSCVALTSIEIPSSVTSIGDYAFESCRALISIKIPEGVKSIGYRTFESCKSLVSIEIPSSVTSIGSLAFNKCTALASIKIPEGVTTIYREAFNGCTALTSIEIPSSATSINGDAFTNCTALVSMIVAESNTKYDSRDNCNAIIETLSNTLVIGCKSTIIPSSVTSIGDYAFYNCTSLTSIEIPSSVTSIGDRAFNGCTALTSIEIPSSVTSLGAQSFDSCVALTSIKCLSNTAPEVSSGTFGNFSSVYTGRNTYDQGINMLYVPADSTGYDASYWLDPLCNSTKCGFTLSKTL